MRIQCVCRQKYNIRDKYSGQHVRCRKCGKHLLVHSVGQAIPVNPAKSGMIAGQPVVDNLALGDLTDAAMYAGPVYGSTAMAPGAIPGRRNIPRPKTKSLAPNFSKLNLGIRLIFGGITLALACSLVALIFIFTGMGILAGLMALGIVAGNVLSMVGYVFCIWAPSQTGARPLIISANVCNGINLFVSLLKVILSQANSGMNTPLLDLVSFGVGTATVVLFLLFLKKVAEYTGDSGAAENAMSLLIFYLVAGGIVFLFVMSLVFIVPALSPKMVVVYVVVGVLAIMIVFFIWLVHFLKFISELHFRRDTRRR